MVEKDRGEALARHPRSGTKSSGDS